MIETTILESEQAVELWPDVREFVERALDHDTYQSITADQIGRQLESGFARLMLIVRDSDILGASVVQMYRIETGRVLHVCTLSGVQMDDWLDELMAAYDDVARDNGCNAVAISGRPGWTKKLVKYGYRTQDVRMAKGIENGAVHTGSVERGQFDSGRERIGEPAAAVATKL